MAKIICTLILVLGFFLSLEADVYRIKENEFTFLTPIDQKSPPLPDAFNIVPGIYTYCEKSYDCGQEGLYRFYNVEKNSFEQRLVFNGNVPTLLHSLTWMHTHGYKDSHSEFTKLLNVAKTRRLHLICGEFTLFALNLLDSLKIPCRFILFLTLEPWNTYNNGHSMLEVFVEGEWILYDIDLRRIFKKDKYTLNAIETLMSIQNGDCEIVQFSKSPIMAFGDLTYLNYDYSFHFERLLPDIGLSEFYRRSAQTILIRENGVFYFTSSPDDKKRIESYGPDFRYLENKEWFTRFYSGILH